MRILATILIVMWTQQVSLASMLPFNDNFFVYVPMPPYTVHKNYQHIVPPTPAKFHQSRKEAEEYGELVLTNAGKYRMEICDEWIGERLRDGEGRTTINVSFTDEEDSGLTWAKDHPDRTLHMLFLRTTPVLAAGSTLKHEIAHTVFATRWPHPNRLPEWVEEGVATRYDDDTRKSERREIVNEWCRVGRVPRLAGMLNSPGVRSSQVDIYTAANLLVEFLLTKGDKPTVLLFAEAGQRSGWDKALRRFYGIESVKDLQTQWNAWIVENYGATERRH